MYRSDDGRCKLSLTEWTIKTTIIHSTGILAAALGHNFIAGQGFLLGIGYDHQADPLLPLKLLLPATFLSIILFDNSNLENIEGLVCSGGNFFSFELFCEGE